MTMYISIYHTNDLHSNYETLKMVHSYLKTNKTENDLYLDSGDYADLKDTIVQADKGLSAFDLINSCGLDGMVVGNNEIDLGHDSLVEVAGKATLLSCNLSDNNNKVVPNVLPYKIITKANVRFLIIGISPFYNKEMQDNNYNGFFYMYNLLVHPCLETIKDIIEDNKGLYDYCILLSHSGIYAEQYIQKVIPQIDLILGGHSHTVYNQPGYSQSGQGEYLGRVILEVNEGTIKEVDNCQIPLELEENEQFDQLLEEKRQHADEILSVELDAIDSLTFDAYKENPLTNFICDALYKHFKADFAIMHNGIASNELTKPISKKSLIETFPSKLNPTIYEISGEKIKEAIEQSFDIIHIHQDGAGAGFRGHTLGTLSYSHNVQIEKDTLKVKVSGRFLIPTRTYRIVTDDYLQRGSGYPSLKVSDDQATWDAWFIRDLVEHYLMDEDVFQQAQIKRIV